MLAEENYSRSFFGIANTEVMIIGMAFLLAALLIRTYVEGRTWIRWYMPGEGICKVVRIRKEEITSRKK